MLGLIQRGIAYIIDALIVYVIYSLSPFQPFDSPVLFKGTIAVVYLTVTDIFLAGSIGKKILGLEIMSSDGDIPSVFQIVARNILKMGGIYYYCVNYVTVPIFGRAIHDFMTKTEVIESEYEYDEEDEDD